MITPEQAQEQTSQKWRELATVGVTGTACGWCDFAEAIDIECDQCPMEVVLGAITCVEMTTYTAGVSPHNVAAAKEQAAKFGRLLEANSEALIRAGYVLLEGIPDGE